MRKPSIFALLCCFAVLTASGVIYKKIDTVPVGARRPASAEFADTSAIRPTTLFDKDGNPLPEDVYNPDIAWQTVRNDNGLNNGLKAVGHLYKDGKPSCSTTVFEVPNCPNLSGEKAQLLTSGHCVMQKGSYSVALGEFDGLPADKVPRFDVAGNVYQSYQNGMDLGIVALNQSYADLARLGIKPFKLATEPMRDGQTYTTNGFPKGNFKDQDVKMRQSRCVKDRDVAAIDFTQMWENTVALTGCSVVGGASGSSLTSDNLFYGIVNTGALNQPPPKGETKCTSDTCLFDGHGEPVSEQKNGGVDVTSLHRCYRECKLDLGLEGCPLPNPENQIRAFMGSPHPTNKIKDLNKPLMLESKFPAYQVKGCVPGPQACKCSDPSGYGPAKTTVMNSFGKKFPAIKPIDFFPGQDPVAAQGQDAKFMFLCIRGQNADGTVDDVKNARNYPIYHYGAQSTAM